MRALVVAAVVAFVIAPYDTQLALLLPLRWLWLSGLGLPAGVGLLVVALGSLALLNIGWNMRVDAERIAAIDKAEQAARDARRGWL